MPVTGEQVKAACLAAGIKSIDHHECAICSVMVRYYVEGGDLFFCGQCGCGVPGNIRRESWDAAAKWINMQSSPEVAERIAAKFGLGTAACPADRGH